MVMRGVARGVAQGGTQGRSQGEVHAVAHGTARRAVRADTVVMRLQLAVSPCVLRPQGAPLPLAPRDAALLAWLALEGPTPRTRLAQLLWPASSPDAARNNLRQRLFQLRKQAGADLATGPVLLALAGGVQHDLDGAATLLGKEPLDLGDEFAAWLQHQRQRLGQGTRRGLADLADLAERTGDWPQALAHAEAVLALAPLAEDAHRRLIRLHYLAGDRAAALLAFDHCEKLLKHEVGTLPSAETLQLLSLVESGAQAPGWRPRVLPASLRRPPHDVGRGAELRALRAAWQTGERVVVAGEPGIGKSRLLAALAADWPQVLTVKARPGDAAVPLALVARVVDALAARHPAWALRPDAVALRVALASAPGGTTGAMPGATPAVVPAVMLQPESEPALGAAQAPKPHGFGPSAVRPSPRPLLPLLLEALASCRVESAALVLDDWQFADDTSVALLEEVLDAVTLADWRIGIATRTLAGPEAEQRLARLRQRGGLRVVDLQPLDAKAVSALVDSLGLGAQGVPALAQALVQRVGGNPLYLLEALRHLMEAGTPLLPQYVQVPPQVRDMVAQRLLHLPERARQLLYAAAVAEGEFSVTLAEAVTGRDALELLEAWGLLEQQGLFGAHGIVHDVYAEAVLGQLPGPISRVLHGRVAAFLEGQPHQPARLAAHWRAAGQDPRAVVHLVAAARQAWHAANAHDCFELFQQAAHIEAARGREAQAFDIWFDCADAVTEIGTPALTVACLQALRPLACNEVQDLRVRLMQAVVRSATGHLEQGMVEATGLLGDAIALGDHRVECECRFAIANRAAADGRFDDALQHLAAGERLMRDHGDPRRAAALAASMALVLGLRGQARLALREQTRMLPLLAAANDTATWTVVCSAKALQHMRQGDLPAALQEARRARAAAARDSIATPDTAVILRNLLDTFRWGPCLGEGLEVADEFNQRLAKQGDYPHALEPIATLYVLLGRADLAQPLLQAQLRRPPARAREQMRVHLLQHQLARMAGGGAAAWPQHALTGEDLPLSAEWALWSGLAAEPPWGPEDLHGVAQRCHHAGLLPLAQAVASLVVWRRLQQGAGAGAGGAHTPPAHAAALSGLHGATPWVALWAGLAWQSLGDTAAARAVVQAGLAWLRDTACPTLPEAFQASYLGRHPVHVALAELGLRLAA
jgi:DNA-binding SARP family transcriptional activator